MPWYGFTQYGSPDIPEVEISVPTGSMFMSVVPMVGAGGSEAQAKSAPSGYLFCNGAEVAQAEFQDLYDGFVAEGVSFGTAADPVNNFILPDLRDVLPIGFDSGDATIDAIGETGGGTSHSHTVSADHTHDLDDHSHAIPNHSHSLQNHTHSVQGHTHANGAAPTPSTPATGPGHNLNPNNTNPGSVIISNGFGTIGTNLSGVVHSHDMYGTTGGVLAGTFTSSGPSTANSQNVYDNPQYTNSTSAVESGSQNVDADITGGSNNNIPPYYAVNYMIKV